MTDREYELLDFIRSKGPVKWYKVLNAFGPITEGQYNNAVLEQSLEDKLIKSIHSEEKRYRRTIRITPKGLLALLAAEEQMQREASVRQKYVRQEQAQKQTALQRAFQEKANAQSDRDAEHRFQTRLSFWNTVLNVILGTLLANMVPGILRWITSFF